MCKVSTQRYILCDLIRSNWKEMINRKPRKVHCYQRCYQGEGDLSWRNFAALSITPLSEGHDKLFQQFITFIILNQRNMCGTYCDVMDYMLWPKENHPLWTDRQTETHTHHWKHCLSFCWRTVNMETTQHKLPNYPQIPYFCFFLCDFSLACLMSLANQKWK